MPLLVVLAILVAWGCYDLFTILTQPPKIKDIEKFQRETVGMSEKEIKKGLREGRW